MAKGIEEFKNELVSNVDLRKEIDEFIESKCAEGKLPEEIAAEVASLLGDKGFVVNAKELLASIKNEVKKELDREDLDAISGGGCCCTCQKQCPQKMCKK